MVMHKISINNAAKYIVALDDSRKYSTSFGNYKIFIVNRKGSFFL